MDILKLSFLCLLFPLLCKAAAENTCPQYLCGINNFAVRFPFQFNHNIRRPAGKSCSYPGFNLSCNNQGQVVLSLPNSGDFYVRNIDYRAQVIQLYDPFKCLPGRLPGLNLSGSPFELSVTRNYTYLSCPTSATRTLSPVVCLTNSSTSTIATSLTSVVTMLTNHNVCRIMVVVPVPVVRSDLYDSGFSSTVGEDLYLKWDTPNCQYCEASKGTCGFNNRSKQDTVCSYKTGGTGHLQVFRIIVLSIALPAVTCSILITIFMCIFGGRRANGQQNRTLASVTPETTPVTTTHGLDESTIESYTKVILGESMRVPDTGLNGATCPICLSDYTAKETVRCVPECKHCFHAECIDEWLRLNGTCPVCRNSPSPVHPRS